ncbi:phage-related baseplate assembly family protein [Lysobacter capsici]|uniref:phage baseplate assembly protein V n=1 Tax=Lysobacter capsici TaxID=435897 RepID=UPI00071677FC|nr:phage baseplate assembly protein V [Lysobacter capsici]ALN85866.1 phage-related baseplate assembly family protein [Lysobacter capsici]
MRIVDLPAYEQLLDERLPMGWGGRWYGVFVALVVDIKDPDNQGRVKVALPWSPDAGGQRFEAWARLATMLGGNNRGSWFVPDVDDEVLVGFEHGDPCRPCVLGGLWNGRDQPPASMDGAGKNYKKVLRSRNGVQITLDDQDGREQLLLETPGGQTFTLKDGPGAVEIADSNGNSIKLETAGITITAAVKVTVNASQVAVSAGMVKVDAAMSSFSGVVKADTVICNSIVSASYTPGAGNIW